MPWAPELFSVPALAGIEERRRERQRSVRFFDGLMTGEIDALIGSFAGEPEMHHPVRGRVKGAPAFARFVTEMTSWMTERHVTVDDVDVMVTPASGVEEVVLHLDGDAGRIELPLALAANLDRDARMIELRMYFSSWPLTGGHQVRPPLLQPDPDLHEPDVVGDYQRALAAGDLDATVAAFEPDGYFREPAGGAYTTAAPTSFAPSTSCSSPMAAGYRSSTAP
jgi:hypothetical protein